MLLYYLEMKRFPVNFARNLGNLTSRHVTRGAKLPLEKSVGHSLKLLDIVKKISAPLRKLIAPLGVPNWLRACLLVSLMVSHKNSYFTMACRTLYA